jgi:hypothetical protein
MNPQLRRDVLDVHPLRDPFLYHQPVPPPSTAVYLRVVMANSSARSAAAG